MKVDKGRHPFFIPNQIDQLENRCSDIFSSLPRLYNGTTIRRIRCARVVNPHPRQERGHHQRFDTQPPSQVLWHARLIWVLWCHSHDRPRVSESSTHGDFEGWCQDPWSCYYRLVIWQRSVRHTWYWMLVVAQRGVVFFRNQDIEIEEQKVLGQRLGELTGKPATSKVWYITKFCKETADKGKSYTSMHCWTVTELPQRMRMGRQMVRSRRSPLRWALKPIHLYPSGYLRDNPQAMRKFYGDLVSPRSTKLASNGWHSEYVL